MVCALLSAAGWILSGLKRLNAAGYIAALTVIVMVLYFVFRNSPKKINSIRFKHRFKQPFAAGFLILTIVTTLGGVLYAPVFFDGLAYRTPRVLSWLSEGHWWWMPDYRGWLNTRAVAFEWVTAPILALFKTDRFLFIINIISFLLLPGLTFSLLTRCGIGKRAAWFWMWLLPTGYGYLTQSGGIGNDLFGSVFAMAAVDFALRAKQSGRASDLMFSMLAAALLTGSKTSNITLGLPWIIIAASCWRLLLLNIPMTTATCALAVLCSFLPVAVNNQRHCGDWTGQGAENAFFHKPDALLFATRGTILLAAQNLNPPIWPLASATERIVNDSLPKRVVEWLAHDSFPGWERVQFREIVAEEDAGWGFGLTLLLLAQFILTDWRRVFSEANWEKIKTREGFWRAAFLISPFLSLMVFQFKSGLTPVARTIMPYYALMLPLCLLVSGADAQVRKRWWKRSCFCVFLLAGAGLVMIPERPLWPALTVLENIQSHSQSQAVTRATLVYETYRSRANVLSPLIEALPSDTKAVGLISVTEPETSLWRPFGSRRVFHIVKGTTPGELAARGVEWVIVCAEMSPEVLKEPLATWLDRFHGVVVRTIPIKVFASAPPNTYLLVRIPADNSPGISPNSP